MIVLFCLPVGLYKPQFLTMNQLRVTMLLVPLIMIGAMGQMLVIAARHVDLSIGSIMAVAAMASGMMFRYLPEIPGCSASRSPSAWGCCWGCSTGAWSSSSACPRSS
jgi:rhamnose transport system permease protein